MRTIEEMLPIVNQATLDGRLSWKKERSKFLTTVGDYAISTWEWSDQNTDASGYSVDISRDGSQIDYIAVDEYSSKYNSVQSLFQNARRSALNVEAVINDIERQIKMLPPSQS
jgi:hypothetical protein